MPNKKQVSKKKKGLKLGKVFITSFVAGIGRLLGMTLGGTFLIFIFSRILSNLGGVPVIGSWIAMIVRATEIALSNRVN